MSLPEVLLWVRLKGRKDPPHIRRQHPLGPYVPDFFCSEARLCIEIDGQSHGFGDRPQRDERRDRYLAAQKVRVLRIPAQSVLEDPEAVAAWIIDEAAAPPQSSG